MSMIINTTDKYFETQSHRKPNENWNGDGWICVPQVLEQKVQENAPYCDLVIENGVLVDVIPTERPPIIESTPQPTLDERIADIEAYIADSIGGAL